MAKKKSPLIPPPVSEAQMMNSMAPNLVKDSEQSMQNGLAQACGFSENNPFGLPTGPGTAGGTESISGIGTIYKNLRWYFISNFRQVLSELYVELGLVRTIVNLPIEDALRGGITIKSKQLDESEIKKLQVSLDRDGDITTVGRAAAWARLFGGGGVIILTDQDPETPLELDQLGPDSKYSLRAVDMWELFWSLQNTEGYDPAIQTEDFEHYDYYGEKLHKSRVMKIMGDEAPSFVRPRLRGWGTSVVESLVRSLNQSIKGADLVFEVLDEFKLDVYKIKNLVNTLMSPNGDQKIKQRIQMANWQKNYQKALVMDSEDDFDHKQLSFAGIAEAQAGIRKQVCADMRFPATKLYGSSETGGLGNADQNDMENYNSMVEGSVRNKIKYDILRVCEIKCQILFGFIPDDLEVEFKPLRVLSAVDEENVKTQKFNRVSQAKAAGEISTLEYRDACNKGNLFDITLDTKESALNPDDPEIEEIVSEGAGELKSPGAQPGKQKEKSGKGDEKKETERHDRTTGEPVNPEPKNKEPKNKAATVGKSK